jgi:hypothetical protein
MEEINASKMETVGTDCHCAENATGNAVEPGAFNHRRQRLILQPVGPAPGCLSHQARVIFPATATC